jgi:cytidylate kinase
MKNFLLNYLDKSEPCKDIALAGPVITISRECGCSANRIAIKLSKILSGYSYQSENKKDVEWKWVNKEVIEKAALELEMNPEKIRNVFLGEVKASLHDVSTAFSTEKMYDADDQKVIDTVTAVIRQLACDGHCIIVGRAASIVTKDIPQHLNIKLQAPLEWRKKRIMKISNMTYAEAQEYILAIDGERDLFVEHIAGRKLDNTDFDIVFNYATMLDDHIVDAIINVMKSKNMIIS